MGTLSGRPSDQACVPEVQLSQSDLHRDGGGRARRIALVSLEQKWQDKDANFSRCAEVTQKAAGFGADLVVFPEMTLTGYSMEMAVVSEDVATGETLTRFGQLAATYGTGIIFGACLVNPVSARPRNELCYADRSGAAQIVYSKIHPFSAAGEDHIIEAGARLGAIEFDDLTIGASICYDLRFPELYAAMAPACNAAVVIASWPASRVAQWRSLLTARAIENQFFVLGVNRIGSDGHGVDYVRSSVIIAPDGGVLEPFASEAELDVYGIAPGEVAAQRTMFPILQDRRRSLYAMLTP